LNVIETFKATSHYGFTHFDVPDFADVIAEAFEMLRRASSPNTIFASLRSPMPQCCTRATTLAFSRVPLSASGCR